VIGSGDRKEDTLPRIKSKLSSRPERQQTIARLKTFGAEWRDPENASSAMPIQGVLPGCACFLASGSAGAEAIEDENNVWDRAWGELPELAWRRKHSRDLSTPAQSPAFHPSTRKPRVPGTPAFAGSFALGRDDRSQRRSPDHPISLVTRHVTKGHQPKDMPDSTNVNL
jgi:hypothetical protein